MVDQRFKKKKENEKALREQGIKDAVALPRIIVFVASLVARYWRDIRLFIKSINGIS